MKAVAPCNGRKSGAVDCLGARKEYSEKRRKIMHFSGVKLATQKKPDMVIVIM
jgi:hypothetical protein